MSNQVPVHDRPIEHLAEHWLLARLGKRRLRPGGRYSVHELCLEADDLDVAAKAEIRRVLARPIKVNARLLASAEWHELLEGHGFRIEFTDHAPMAVLKPRRTIQDEGSRGVARITFTLLRNPAARKRVLGMRAVFNKYEDHLAAIAVVAVKQ